MYKKSKFATIIVFVMLSASSATGSNVFNQQSTNMAPLNTLYQYHIINSINKNNLSVGKLAEEFKKTDVIFMGEFHSHQGGHKLQLDLLEALFKQNPKIVLSMEQFTRNAQPIVDGYLAGKYGEETLIDDGDAWDGYKGSYRAIVEFARDHKIPVIAANAPAMFVHCVGKKGVNVLKAIPEEQQLWSARELDMENDKYKAKFFSFLNESGTRHGQTVEEARKRQMNTYAAQLLRDTTMAESIDAALKSHPGHQVIHLNGAFHSDSHLGTAAILETMQPELTTSVISPVMVDDPQNPSANDEQYSQGDYLYLLRSLPERYVDEDKESAAVIKLITERMKKKCEL